MAFDKAKTLTKPPCESALLRGITVQQKEHQRQGVPSKVLWVLGDGCGALVKLTTRSTPKNASKPGFTLVPCGEWRPILDLDNQRRTDRQTFRICVSHQHKAL